MDAPVWTNDLVYLDQMVITILITIAIIGFCFYISKRADRRRDLRVAHTPTTLDVPPDPDDTSAHN